MKRLIITLFFALVPVALAATPALYDVTGVASDDVLNIRAAPRAGADRLGGLGPDATGIEVVRQQNGWGLVNHGEATGWVSMRYIRLSAESPAPGTFPAPLHCFGTEPFWSLTIARGDEVRYRPMDGGEKLYRTQTRLRATNDISRHGFIAGGSDGIITATIAPRTCNDGMSDREYGFGIDAIMRLPDGHRMLSGCCSLPGG